MLHMHACTVPLTPLPSPPSPQKTQEGRATTHTSPGASNCSFPDGLAGGHRWGDGGSVSEVSVISHGDQELLEGESTLGERESVGGESEGVRGSWMKEGDAGVADGDTAVPGDSEAWGLSNLTSVATWFGFRGEQGAGFQHR